MSGGRVSIPNNVRKTIQNIKEITGNHSDDEIYAMLKECSMDPNETAQKLLLQDPFHEVKRKRDRKKENLHEESTEPRWKPGMQGRGNRSRHISNGGGKTSLSIKENGINQRAEDGTNPSKPQGQKNKETVAPSSSHDVTDGSSDIIAKNTRIVPAAHASVGSDKKKSEGAESTASSKLQGPLSKTPDVTLGSGSAHGLLMSTSMSKSPSPSPGVYLSESDPILMPSQDSRLPVGTIRRQVGSQRNPVEKTHETPLEIKSTAMTAGSELQGVGKNLLSESSRPGAIARPSSTYNNRLQQAIGPQKVGPSMEWKPKPTNPILAQGTGSAATSSNLDSKDDTSELEGKLEESHISISNVQHVIIPNHLHVPEAEKLGFCFGSFDASFGLNASSSNNPVSDKSSVVTEEVDESIEEQSRNQNDEGDHPDRPTSSSNVPENLSSKETSLPVPGHQYPNFSFGFMPPIIGSQLTSFERNESQARDGSHVPSFIVQQPFDPATYYAQFYHPGADSDGRMSPFHSTGVQTKFNGNVAVLPPQASQPSQEVVNSLIATQATEVMQSSIAVTQQPLPVFRQPTGVHLPNYPPNYNPYAPYFNPFYVPHPAILHFLNNGSFPPKYPLPQYKPGSNSTSNEDLGGSQFKESNVYITGQQSEGSGVWIAGPGRDVASSFYNLPQGSQVAHGPFGSIYHPAQPVTSGAVHPLLQQSQMMAGAGVDMGPAASVYQQPQPAQINWPNNY